MSASIADALLFVNILVSGIFHGHFAQRLAVNKPCLQIVRHLLWKQTTTHSIRNNNAMFEQQPLSQFKGPSQYIVDLDAEMDEIISQSCNSPRFQQPQFGQTDGDDIRIQQMLHSASMDNGRTRTVRGQRGQFNCDVPAALNFRRHRPYPLSRACRIRIRSGEFFCSHPWNSTSKSTMVR